ncbi:uncharacterized protein UV8b_01203 [Ustilaginoidea virens]|uniref:Zn(2)-C6 fungal-type domain-containing protein n=2 Tax=Ustilaginoidea virens TaxID=1159556 RepID=A0A8E5HKI1_USTVR|nr:uncharacterized protein UV8b_01203 [Ustilaginoidea virens]QUC16962.1 hypothetical protein UV8b_01203 [Ustilaginoidea virens]
MCRSRRVKCDEALPICDRCRKGNRDCVYPDPPTSKSSQFRGSIKYSTKPFTDGGNGDSDPGVKPLETIVDEDEGEDVSPSAGSDSTWSGTKTISSSGHKLSRNASSESMSQDNIRKSPPSVPTLCGTDAAASPDSYYPMGGRADWSHLAPDYQHHLNYFAENITNFHYSITYDEDNFFGRILPFLAVQHEPLLNALVGFTSYHAALQNPDGKLQGFLTYYNRSVTLLLESLTKKEMNNVLNLVTILQLLTIEEYLGDWVNLMGHQKAAFQVIRKIFTPVTVMQTAVGRACINWYTRYDCFVAIQGGFPTDLPKAWFNLMNEHYKSRMDADVDDISSKISLRSTRLRSISYDMSILYARGSRGQITSEDFAREHSKITDKLFQWKTTWDKVLADPDYLVTDFPYIKEPDPDDIVNPYTTGLLYHGLFFTTTLIHTEWASTMLMHLSQSPDMPSEKVFAEMAAHAYTVCQAFGAVESWPLKPKGALIPFMCCISIASVFLPQTPRNHMWIRRKFALLENMGFIQPTERRLKLAVLFRDPSCAHWWLPNEEGLTPVLRAIKLFADERNAAAVNAQHENIREVRHVFAKLETAELAFQQAQRDRVP